MPCVSPGASETLFLLDRQTPTRRSFSWRERLASLIRPGPNLHRDRSQRRPVGGEGLQGVHEGPAAGSPIQRAGSLDLLMGTGHLRGFRGVLHQQHDRLRGHPLSRGGDMRFEHLGVRNLGVVEKPIRGGHLGVPAARGGNAGGRPIAQIRQHSLQPFLESFIVQLSPLAISSCAQDAISPVFLDIIALGSLLLKNLIMISPINSF